MNDWSVDSKTHSILNGVLIAVLAVVVGVNLWHFTSGGGATRAVGKEAPQFKQPTLKGGDISLSSLSGQVVVLDFWATWCPPCGPQLDNLKKLTRQGETPQGLRVLSVNTDAPGDKRRSKVESYVKSHDSPFTTVLDNGRTSQAYGADSLPTIVVIDREGVITHARAGLHSTAKLRALVWEAAGGTTP